MKSRYFILKKEFPLSPNKGYIAKFLTDKDMNDGIYNVGALPNLMLSDCVNYPEFWEEITDNLVLIDYQTLALVLAGKQHLLLESLDLPTGNLDNQIDIYEKIILKLDIDS